MATRPNNEEFEKVCREEAEAGETVVVGSSTAPREEYRYQPIAPCQQRAIREHAVEMLHVIEDTVAALTLCNIGGARSINWADLIDALLTVEAKAKGLPPPPTPGKSPVSAARSLANACSTAFDAMWREKHPKRPNGRATRQICRQHVYDTLREALDEAGLPHA